MLHDDINKTNKENRNIIRLAEDKIISYDAIINDYVEHLNCYVTELENRESLNLDNLEKINYNFYYCVGFLLNDFIKLDDLDFLMDIEKIKKNPHYDAILTVGYKIIKYFNKYGLHDLAFKLELFFHITANAIYDYEKSFTKEYCKKCN